MGKLNHDGEGYNQEWKLKRRKVREQCKKRIDRDRGAQVLIFPAQTLVLIDPESRSGRSIRRQKSRQMYGRKIYLSPAVRRGGERVVEWRGEIRR